MSKRKKSLGQTNKHHYIFIIDQYLLWMFVFWQNKT